MRIFLILALLISLNAYAGRSDGKEPGTNTEWLSVESTLRMVYPKQVFDDLNEATARLATDMIERQATDPNILLLPDIQFRGINGLYPTSFSLDWKFVSLGVPATEITHAGFQERLHRFATEELLHYREFRNAALFFRAYGVEIKVETQLSLLVPYMELLRFSLNENALKRKIEIVMREHTGEHQPPELKNGLWTIYVEIDPTNIGDSLHRLDQEFGKAPADCAYDLRGKNSKLFN